MLDNSSATHKCLPDTRISRYHPQTPDKGPKEQLLTLEHNLRRQELAAQNDQVREFLSLDDSFHQLLTQIANCPLAWETIESIKATMDRVRFLSLSQVSPPPSLIQQHYLIFSALKARDPDAAEKAIREHLQEMIYSITPIAQQNSDWFEHA